MVGRAEYRYDLFISHADADCAWVNGYLLDALQQAGLRCYSEEAFALGVPRLLEFERAIQDSKGTLLVLSPAYLVESFGQFTDLLAQSYGLETATWPVVPLILHPVQLPPRLAMLTGLDATDPDKWAAAVERLCAGFQRPVPSPAPQPPCPYPGMAPFGEADGNRFYGRDGEVQDLLQSLRLHPFLDVIGPSGSGKSSLVFAGLVPALRQSGLFGPGDWLVRALRPGERPLAALAEVLHGDPAAPERAVSELLGARADTRRLLLIVDQFEETFTLAGEEAGPFQRALLRLAQTPECYVVLTVRADFCADLMTCPLWREIQAHRVEVLPLGGDGLRQAIVMPAEDAGVFVEAALVERLVGDAAGEPGVLPLVQETLVLLWERVERRFLPLGAYEALVLPRGAYGEAHGEVQRTGLQVAIARRADAALAGLQPQGQAVARRILLRLVQFGEGRADTRRQQPVAALRSAGDELALFESALHHLADSRLLTLSGGEGGEERRVDIAHEALIDGWPVLRGWLAERRGAEQARRRLEGKAAEWERLGRGSGGLLDQVALLEAERWLESADAAELGHSAALAALVGASRAAIDEAAREKEAARRRELAQARALAEEQAQRAEEQARATGRLRRVLAGLAVMFLVAVVAAVFAGTQRSEALQAQDVAESQRDEAERQRQIALSRQLAAQALNHVDDQLDLALLLSLEANRIDDTPEVRGSLLPGLSLNPHLDAYLHGHADDVSSVAFDPDGNTLATGSYDGTIRLWDAKTRQPLGSPLQGHGDWVKSVAFSPDGGLLASGSADETVMLWDMRTHQRLDPPLKGHTGRVQGVAFSPEGKTLASGSDDKTVILWDVETGRCLGRLDHTNPVYSVAFSPPDGRVLAAASCGEQVEGSCEQGAIFLWDVDSQQFDGSPLVGHDDWVISVAFSPDGKTLASGSLDGSVLRWDVAAHQAAGPPLAGHTKRVPTVAFSPDGDTLASGSWDNTIVLWDIAASPPLSQRLEGHTLGVRSVAFSHDGRTLASGSSDNTAILWDLKAAQSLGDTLGHHSSSLTNVAFSPDGQILALASEDGTVLLWSVARREFLSPPLDDHAEWVSSVVFSPDGRTLASASDDDTIILWDVETQQRLGSPLVGHTDNVIGLAFSPDGGTLASGDQDGIIRLWDVETQRPLQPPLQDHGDSVNSVAFSPGGQTLASGSDDTTVILWDVASRQRLGSPLDDHTDWVLSVAFSPDGKKLATGCYDGTIIVWDVDRRQSVRVLRGGHTDMVNTVAFGPPDGHMLASCGDDKKIILWDVATGQPIGSHFAEYTDQVWSIAYSPDGDTLASVSGDGTFALWDVRFESWKSRACRRANRNLTMEEWERFIDPNTPGATYKCSCPDLPPGD